MHDDAPWHCADCSCIPVARFCSWKRDSGFGVQCKVGKVIGNLKALQQLFPETVNAVAVIEYMPTLLLSNMQKVAFLKPNKFSCRPIAEHVSVILFP